MAKNMPAAIPADTPKLVSGTPDQSRTSPDSVSNTKELTADTPKKVRARDRQTDLYNRLIAEVDDPQTRGMDRPKLLAQIGETLARMEDSKLSDLADRVQALEKENASLTTKLTDGETATKTLNSQIKTLGDRLKDSQDANTEYRAERQTREDEIKALQADKKELQTENKTLQERVKLLQPLEDARLKAEVARIDEDYRLQQNSRIDIHPTVRQQTTDEYYRVHPELRPPNYQTPEEREERAKERAGRKERQTDSTFRSPN